MTSEGVGDGIVGRGGGVVVVVIVNVIVVMVGRRGGGGKVSIDGASSDLLGGEGRLEGLGENLLAHALVGGEFAAGGGAREVAHPPTRRDIWLNGPMKRTYLI